MRKIKKLVTVVSSLMIVALSAGPAATQTPSPWIPDENNLPPHIAAGAILGTASLSAGLYYPVSPDCLPDPICDNAQGTWELTIDAGAAVHYEPPTPDAYVGAGTLATDGPIEGDLGPGAGNLGAYCGYSQGSSGAGIINLDQLAQVPLNTDDAVEKLEVADVGWLQSAATLILFTGNVVEEDDEPVPGTIAGLVSAIPPVPGGPSCLNGQATTFTVVGAVAAYWGWEDE